MADDTHKIALELVLEGQQQIDQGLKKVAKDTATFGSVSKRLEKQSIRHAKERSKLEDKWNSPKAKKKLINDEKAVNTQLKERIALIRKQGAEVDKLARKMERVANGQDANDPRNDPRGRRSLGRGIRRAAGGAALAAAGAGIGLMSSQIRQGYAQHMQYGMGRAGMMGSGATTAGLDAVLGQGTKLGYDKLQGVQQARAVAMATGNYKATTTAQELTRSTMLDMGQSTGLMGQLTQAGGGFGGAEGNAGSKQLQKIITLGFSAGISKARLPEFIQGATGVIKAQAARQGGNIDSVGYASVLQAMGASGASGLQGARGASVFQRLNESIVKPGGGEAGQAMMLQAFGFGKPGGGSSYYEAIQRQEEGATPENVKAMFAEFGKQKGGGEAQILALKGVTGLNTTVLEELRDVAATMEGPARDEKLQSILDKAQETPESRAADGIDELGDMAKQAAIVTNHSLTIGAQVAESVKAMQLALNEMVTQLMPFAIKVLEAIALIMKEVANLMGGGLEGTNLDADIFGIKRRTDPETGEVATNFKGDTVGEYDVANLTGGDKYNKVERKAINEINKKYAVAQIGYDMAMKADPEAQNAADAKYLTLFEPGGLFFEEFQAQKAIALAQLEATKEASATAAAAAKSPVPPGIAR